MTAPVPPVPAPLTLDARMTEVEAWRARVSVATAILTGAVPIPVIPPVIIPPVVLPPVVVLAPPPTLPPVVVIPPAPNLPGIFDDYSPQVPHWSHIRIEQTDWRVQNLTSLAQQASELAWMNAHTDLYMGGLQRNQAGTPEIEYLLSATVIQPGQAAPDLSSSYYADLVAFYNRPASIAKYGPAAAAIERCLQHYVEPVFKQVVRVEFTIWGSRRFSINPSAPGLLEYEIDRITRIRALEVGFMRRGVFSDEVDGGNTQLPWIDLTGASRPTIEYPTRSAWVTDFCTLITGIRAALPGLVFQGNISEYVDPAGDSVRIAVAMGWAHCESLINPQRVEQFSAIDSLLAKGVTVQIVDAVSPEGYAHGLVPLYPPGAEATPSDRGRMYSLGYYYMTVTTPDQLYLTVDNPEVAIHPSAACWIKAIEANFGAPTAKRSIIATAMDPANKVAGPVYARPFTRGWWFFRGIPSWAWSTYDYGDASIVNVALPPGKWLRCLADGSLVKLTGLTVPIRVGESFGIFDATQVASS